MFENQMKLIASSKDFEALIVQFNLLFRDVYQLFNNRSIQFELWPSMPPQPKRLGGCFMGASLNIPEIPTASWACMDDFDWCLDGLPMHSTIAVSTNGVLSNPNSMNLFINGLHTVQQKLSPSTLLINTTSITKLESISDVKQYDNILLYSNIGQRRRNGEMNKNVQSQKVLFDLEAIEGGNYGR